MVDVPMMFPLGSCLFVPVGTEMKSIASRNRLCHSHFREAIDKVRRGHCASLKDPDGDVGAGSWATVAGAGTARHPSPALRRQKSHFPDASNMVMCFLAPMTVRSARS